MALDQGTTSTRAILFDGETAEIVASARREFTQYYPRPGWVEHDMEEVYGTVTTVLREAVRASGVSSEDIECLGITNQRETAVAWDKGTGKPLAPAVVWQCRRTAQDCKRLERDADALYAVTGLRPDAYFSATKFAWLLRHDDAVRRAADEGRLCLGTVDSYLLYRLTGGETFATDVTNASRTMLCDLRRARWSDDLLQKFGIRREWLPSIQPSAHLFGMSAPDVLGFSLPVCGVAGDQQAALYGQRCTAAGQVKCTFGTGCFLLCHTGDAIPSSRSGLLSTAAAAPHGTFALEGSVFTAGAAVQWLRDELHLVSCAAETSSLAESVPNSGGVFFVPAFVGLGAPYWDSDARGLLCGLTRGSGAAHIVRATLESIAYMTADVLAAMREDTGLRFERLAVDGGASANRFLMQFLSDVTGAEIVRPRVFETTALGAAMLAATCYGGETAGIGKAANFVGATFAPQIREAERASRLDDWHAAVRRARSFR